ncbi:MAG: hypothetical protein O2979_12805 [Proteobacteria bacterium]|nr:hypothetical protein [Pseudomonadota bacterium]
MLWKVAGVALLVVACAAVFAAYLRPDMVVTYASAFAAFCGF